MKSVSRARLAMAGLVGTAFVLATAALAWACIPSSNLWSEPDFAPSGEQVRIQGQGFPGSSMEIRWGSKDGPVLATGPAPDFDLMVTVPQAADGVYLLFAVAYEQGADGSLTARGFNRTPLEVTASNVRGSWGDGGWRQEPGKDPDGGPVQTPEPPPIQTPEPPPVQTPEFPPVQTPAPVDGTQPAASPPPAAATSPQPADNPRPGGPDGTALRLGEETPPTEGAARRSGDQSAASPPTAASQALQTAEEQAAPAASRTDPALVSGDLWSGFEGEPSASLTADEGVVTADDASPGYLAVGVGLLGAGLVTLLGGMALALARRRPARSLTGDELR